MGLFQHSSLSLAMGKRLGKCQMLLLTLVSGLFLHCVILALTPPDKLALRWLLSFAYEKRLI
jgi:hypothetical protein